LQRFGQVLMKKMYLLLQKLSYKFTNRNYKIKVLTEYTFRAKYFSANHFYVCFFKFPSNTLLGGEPKSTFSAEMLSRYRIAFLKIREIVFFGL
jgi:hypothetical protein